MAIDSVWVTENRNGTICSISAECPSKKLDSYDKLWARFERVYENRVVFESEARPVEVDGHSITGVWLMV